jgi:hypothetical protein
VSADLLRVLYVGSWSRSGSTLLDLMLGQIPGFVSVGELRYLWHRGLGERQLCGCGTPLPDCPFWRNVLDEAFGSADRVDASAILALQRRVDGLARLPWVLAPWRPPRLERELRAYREVLGRVYRAVRTVSGGSVLVDSSKYAAYGAILAGVPDLDVRLIHLVRDSRAVAYSWTRRKRRLELTTEARDMPVHRPSRSAAFWSLENLALDLLHGASRGYHVLRYEDLAGQPQAALGAALQGIGMTVDLGFLRDHRVHLGQNHTVAGNPLRFQRGDLAISPDTEWQSQMGWGARRAVTALTWPLLLRYGFRRDPAGAAADDARRGTGY